MRDPHSKTPCLIFEYVNNCDFRTLYPTLSDFDIRYYIYQVSWWWLASDEWCNDDDDDDDGDDVDDVDGVDGDGNDDDDDDDVNVCD